VYLIKMLVGCWLGDEHLDALVECPVNRQIWIEITSIGHSLVEETSMTLIWLGVLLVFGGVLQMAYQPIWRGRLSGGKRLRSGRPNETLEPERPASGFGIKSNWPGLAMFALGAAFLLAGAAI
jgi:hypothetical protein